MSDMTGGWRGGGEPPQVQHDFGAETAPPDHGPSDAGQPGADARTQVARQWLPVVDNLERALEHAAADPRTIVEGIQAVRQQALDVLASLGFPRRDDTGATFDPTRHEAVAATHDPRVPPGTIVQVVRPGYGEPGRQLRPAQVVVAKAD